MNDDKISFRVPKADKLEATKIAEKLDRDLAWFARKALANEIKRHKNKTSDK